MAQQIPFAVIVVSPKEIKPEDQEFVKEWASDLNLPIGKLLKRIMIAAVSGETFEEKIPERPKSKK